MTRKSKKMMTKRQYQNFLEESTSIATAQLTKLLMVNSATLFMLIHKLFPYKYTLVFETIFFLSPCGYYLFYYRKKKRVEKFLLLEKKYENEKYRDLKTVLLVTFWCATIPTQILIYLLIN